MFRQIGRGRRQRTPILMSGLNVGLIVSTGAALGGMLWFAWEVIAHWVHFDGYFANGAFQLLNPLRRILDGQTYGRDFLNFHGIGTIWLHVPAYVLAGSDFRASEFARFTTSGILHAVASLALAKAFFRENDDRRISVIFFLLLFASGPLLTNQVFFPHNSMLGVRSFFPLLIAVALSRAVFLPQTYGFARISAALAASLLTSVEHGLAATCALAVTLLAALLTRQPAHLGRQLFTGTLTGLILFALVLVAVTEGAIGKVLQYSLSDIPDDQFWYFGSPPNAFLPQDWKALIIYSGYIRFEVLFVTAWAMVLGFWRKDQLFIVVLFLISYATFGLISQLGYLSAQSLQASERAVFAVILATGLRVAGARFIAVPVCAAIGYFAFGAQRAFEEVPPSAIVRTESFLSSSWRDHLSAVNQYAGDGNIWSVYTGLPEAYREQFPPTFDYIIHAVGAGNRVSYVAKFLKARPDLVRLDNTWRWGYGAWLLLENWSFYREVFRAYHNVYSDKWGSLWMPRKEKSAKVKALQMELTFDNDGCVHIPSSREREIYTLDVRYVVRNTWGWLPIIGKTPRLFLNLTGVQDPNLRTVSLPISESYGGMFTFPIIPAVGEPVMVCPAVSSFLSGVTLQLQFAKVQREDVDVTTIEYLYNQR